jgi:hypothetical protein
MDHRSAWLWAVPLLVTVLGGCEAILQFDEKKLNSSSGAGAAQGGGGSSQGGGGQGGSSAGGSGAGGSGGCQSPADCPAPGSECETATCDGGVCGSAKVQSGQPIAKQTAGDCQKVVCDGSGTTMSVADDTDVPMGGKACVVDSCASGKPTTTPADAGHPCNDPGGKVCDGKGACVGCLTDGDCSNPTPKCSNQKCVSASCGDGMKNGDETDTDCGGSCGATCKTNQTCGGAKDCESGVCTNNKCAGPACNDGIKNGSETDTDCGGSCPKCGPNKGCNSNGDCQGNQCSGVGGTCVPNCSDGVKNNAETGVDCGGGACPGCGVGGPCGQDIDCTGGEFCSGGACAAKKPNGQVCGAPKECTSNVCADGVCCNSACGGACQACNLPGSMGSCTNIPSGQPDPAGCSGASACDGNGACKKTLGQACGGAGDCVSASCVDGVCCNTGCIEVCRACNVAGSIGTCTNVANGQTDPGTCASPGACNGAGACQKPNGSGCSTDSECNSGHCADGACCNTACTGTCQACNLAGLTGTCATVSVNSPDPDTCAAPNVCNGSGVCLKAQGAPCASNAECQSTFCADGYCCNTACTSSCHSCSGQYNSAGVNGTCGPVDTCQPYKGCGAGKICSAGSCVSICP